MKPVLALLLAAALSAADDDAELVRTVDELVRELGAPTAEARMFARFRLASYGDRVRQLLERVESDDPEVRRAIRQLTRAAGKVELVLLPRADEPLRIGATLVLEVRMINNTDQTYALLPYTARQGGRSGFVVRVGGKAVQALGIDQVNWGDDDTVTIAPGATRRFQLTLGPGSSPLRRPALYDVSVAFEGPVARGYGTLEDGHTENDRLSLETTSIRVHVLGRRADELEQALSAENAREREAAATELSMRDDEAVLPILRRHARERPLRLAAVRRLAALGAKEDFDLINEATFDESIEVRRAAVLGLANYNDAKVRWRLQTLATDPDVHSEAIRALRGHMHVATVEFYVSRLASGTVLPEDEKFIRATIRDWTGMWVDVRPAEIAAFKTWWQANRAEWARKHASDR